MSESLCLQCEHKRICATGIQQPSENVTVNGCSRFEQKKPQTNADRIRAMTDEELAAFMTEETESYLSSAGNTWLDWLKHEVTE